MKKMTGHSQTIIDQNETDILEDNRAMRESLEIIDQAKIEKMDRQIAIATVAKYLDGQEYNLNRISAEVSALLGQVTQGFISVGQRLLAVKKVEGHGFFIKWLEQNFSLSGRSANYFMHVADKLEKRPELAAFSRGGISKAVALLEMPEEYLDEYVQEGTIDGKPLDEYHTMTRNELVATVKKLKGSQEKIVAEETKALKAEKDALVRENARLKKFEPAQDTTPEWCIERAEEIRSCSLRIVTLARQLMNDERLKGEFSTQGKMYSHISMAQRALVDLDHDFIDTFDME